MGGAGRAALWSAFGLLVGVALSLGVAAIADPGSGEPSPGSTITVPSAEPTGHDGSPTPTRTRTPTATKTPSSTRSPSDTPSPRTPTSSTSSPGSSSSEHEDEDEDEEEDD